MARVTSPLFSLDASGSVAKSIVYSKWKGRNYVRQHSIPANPKSAAQVAIRAAFAWLGAIWAGIEASVSSSWETLADQSLVSEFNVFCQKNIDRIRQSKGPTQSWPAAEEATDYALNAFSGEVDGSYAVLTLGAAADQADIWGAMIYQSTSTGFTPAPTNLAKMVEVDNSGSGDASAQATIGPLDAGTYYFRANGFSDDGLIDETETTEVELTIS